jgi:hypothetical protein
MKVVDAHASVSCYDEDGNLESSNINNVAENNNDLRIKKDGCYVTLNFTAQKFDPDHSPYYPPSHFEWFFQEKENEGKHLDAMRYTIELKAVGSSTVRYKGFDDEGYSVCCSMLKNNHNSVETTEICEWVNQSSSSSSQVDAQNEEQNETETKVLKVQKLTSKTSCPLNNDADYNVRIIDGRRVFKNLIHGQVERPLHRKIFGKWEARIEFYRDTTAQGVGRLVIPFELSAAVHGQNAAEKVFQNSAATVVSSVSKSESHQHINTEGAVIPVEKKE